MPSRIISWAKREEQDAVGVTSVPQAEAASRRFVTPLRRRRASQREHAYHRLIEAEIIDPTRIPPAQREVIFRRLYRVHQQIFAGVLIESFITYLVRPDALRTRIQIYRNEAGGIVGYCAVHLFERELDGRTVGVIRAEAGLLPGYRGTSATLWFGGSEALRYKGSASPADDRPVCDARASIELSYALEVPLALLPLSGPQDACLGAAASRDAR